MPSDVTETSHEPQNGAAAAPPAPPAEAPAAPAVPPPNPNDERLSRAMSQVARTEAELVRKQRAFAHERQTFEAERAAIAKEAEESKALKTAIEQIRRGANPIDAMRSLGVDFDDFVDRVAKTGTPENMIREARSHLEDQIADLQKKLEEQNTWRQKQEEREQQQHAAQQFENAARWAVGHVEQNHGEYPLLVVRTPQRIAALLDRKAIDYQAEHGVIPSIDIAAAAVEADLANELRGDPERVSRFAPKAAAPATTAKPAAKGTSPAPDTSQQTSEAPTGEEEESMAAVIQRRRDGRFQAPAKPLLPSITNKAASERTSAPAPVSREALRRQVAAKHLQR